MKLREFWIVDFPDLKRQVSEYKIVVGLPFFKPDGDVVEVSSSIHVIEYSAYDKLKTVNQKLTEQRDSLLSRTMELKNHKWNIEQDKIDAFNKELEEIINEQIWRRI